MADYEDIIYLPHPVSARHGAMSNGDRAAQFAPFAALTGYDAELAETARLTTPRAELTEGEQQRLNEVYRYLQDRISLQPSVTVTYFQPDRKKDGGAYITVTASVKKIDEYNQTIIFTTGESIPIWEIVEITLEKKDKRVL